MPVIAVTAPVTLMMVKDVVRVVKPPRFIQERQQHMTDQGHTLVVR